MTTGFPAAHAPWVLRGVRLWSDPSRGVDLLIRDGRLQEPSAAEIEQLERDGAVVDGGGALALPGLVDAHCHVDKTLWGAAWRPHQAADDIRSRIDGERESKRALGIPDPARSAALLRQMVSRGTTHVRTHTDVDTTVGTEGVTAVREAAASLGGAVDVQQVAFPQSGVLRHPGTLELLAHAVDAGAEVLGGLDPAGIDDDPARSLDLLFDLAADKGVGLDFHLHDPGTLGLWETRQIVARTRDRGMGGRVTVSHAFGIFGTEEAERGRALEDAAEHGVSFVTAAVYDVPVPQVLELRERGVTLGLGNDGIRDTWGPWGDGDMLTRTMHLAYRDGMRRDEDVEAALGVATSGGRAVLGHEANRLVPGDPADLVLVDAQTATHAVAARPARRLVVSAGRVVARDGEYVGPGATGTQEG